MIVYSSTQVVGVDPLTGDSNLTLNYAIDPNKSYKFNVYSRGVLSGSTPVGKGKATSFTMSQSANVVPELVEVT